MPSDSTPDDRTDGSAQGERAPGRTSENEPKAMPDAMPDAMSDVVSDAAQGDVGDIVGDAQEAIEAARRRLADVPAARVVTNHVMGLYELAAIHLSSATPDLASAALAIDAVAYLVDGLGERLGADSATLRDALANIRMAFVQIKAQSQAAPTAPAAPPSDPTEG